MAKKTPRNEPGSKPRGRPKSIDPKARVRIVMTIRAGEDWEAWVDEAKEALLRQTGLSIKLDRTAVIDAALGLLAEKLGLPAPPRRF
jgi:transposase